MKRNLLYIFLLVLSAWSCTNSDESVFSETADTRLNNAIASYQKQLTEVPNGWNARVISSDGINFSFFLKFDDQNRVKMYSDFSSETAGESKESSYRLKALQTPTLIFDTYSYLHLLADPDGNVNGGPDGVGLQTDFEFAIYPDSITADRMVFVGRRNDSQLVLERASSEDEVAYGKGGLAKSLEFYKSTNYRTYFKQLRISNVVYDVNPNFENRSISFEWVEGGAIKKHTTYFYFTVTGIKFVKPLVNGSTIINDFTGIEWDDVKNLMNITVNGTRTALTEASFPLQVDKTAFIRFKNQAIANGGLYYPIYNIVVDGIEDYYKLEEIPNFEFLFYYPSYGTAGNTVYDGFAIFNGSGIVGPAVVPVHSSNTGKTIFRILGTFGDSSEVTALLSDYISNPSGFYFIQKSEQSFDMVSAKDGRSWINWRWTL